MNFFLLFLCLLFAFGQKGGDVEVSGKIINKSTLEGLPYATISLLDKDNGSFVTGVISNDSGFFVLRVLPGSYVLKTSFVGYKTRLDTIKLNKEKVWLGAIALEIDSLLIGEVLVEGEKPTIEITPEKKIYNVREDPTAAGQSLKEVLQKMPGVSIDEEGNLVYRGRHISEIYINNVRSIFSKDPEKLLESLKSEVIERVELITSRTAKYRAEGGGSAILNIILRKGREERNFYSNVSAEIGYPEKYSLNLLGELRISKGTLSLMYSPSKNTLKGYIYHLRTKNYTGERATQFTTFTNDMYNNIFSLEYKLNTKAGTIGAGISSNMSYWENTRNNSGIGYLGNYNRPSVGSYYNFPLEPQFYADLSLSSKFNSKILIKGEYRETINKEFIEEKPLDLYTGDSIVFQEVRDVRGMKGIDFSLDNTINVNDSLKIEFGARFINDFDYISTLSTIKRGNYSRSFYVYGYPQIDFISQELGIYSQMTHTLKRYYYTLGVRYERVEMRYLAERLIYNNVFPNFIFGVNVGKIAFQLGYSYRIRRPEPTNEFFNVYSFIDKYNYFGNPGKLRPSFTHAFELSLISQKSKIPLPNFYFSAEKDKITRVRIRKGDTLFMSLFNIKESYEYGVEGMVPIPLKVIFAGLNFSVNKEIVRHKDSLYAFSFSRWGGRLGLITRGEILAGLGFQALLVYLPSHKVPYGRRINIIWVDAGLYKKIGKHAKVTFSVSDLLNTRRFGGNFDYTVFQVESRIKMNQRSYVLNISIDLGAGERERKIDIRKLRKIDIPEGM